MRLRPAPETPSSKASFLTVLMLVAAVVGLWIGLVLLTGCSPADSGQQAPEVGVPPDDGLAIRLAGTWANSWDECSLWLALRDGGGLRGRRFKDGECTGQFAGWWHARNGQLTLEIVESDDDMTQTGTFRYVVSDIKSSNGYVRRFRMSPENQPYGHMVVERKE